jgi:hypothetical protein
MNLKLHEDVKLGKTPATQDKRDIKFATLLDTATLPPLPHAFGHPGIVGSWGMLGNDQVGDCVIAGGMHEVIMWTRESKTHADATFSTATAIEDYSRITGYNPDDPNSDQGTDMRVAALYRQKTGLVDVHGRRHKIGAFASLSPGSMSDLDYAIYLFGAAGIGIEFPSSAMDQFNAGQVWDVVRGAQIEGGHYIPGVEKLANGNYGFVTWGKEVQVTPRFLEKYMDEGFGYVSTEMLAYGKSPEGFNVDQLKADLAAIHA